ncbi:MAG TPA: RsbRD N-terminal domain-containing protein, partial [Patescibacteria group bacterium]|nr:RsbRD N-terminal domain-containing protein [Patescibacteria group bacterium]
MRSLAQLIEESREDLLKVWMDIVLGNREEQKLPARPSGADAVGMGVILDRLIAGLQRAAQPMIQDPAFADLVHYMVDVSAARAREGYSPSATARFVMSLKTASAPVLATEYGGIPERWRAETTVIDDIMDQLAVLTFEAFVVAREEVITHQSQAMLEISTPALRIWKDVVMMPLVGVVDTRRAQHIME